jgi:hypothetical protein
MGEFMSRTLSCGINCCGEVFRANVALPDEYFSASGIPLWHRLNARFSSPVVCWDQIIGGVPRDEVVASAPQPIPISEELQKLREVVASLEKKFDGVSK